MRYLLVPIARRLCAVLLAVGLTAAGGAARADDDDDDDDEVDAGTDGDDDPDDEPDDDDDSDPGDDDDEDPDAGAGTGQEPGRDAGGESEVLPEEGLIGALVDVDQHVFCSAALLTPDTVLTAAHCVAQDGVVRWPWGFFVGEDVTLGGEFVRVLDGAVHPAYDDFLHTADLAVLRIAGGGPRAGLALDDAVPTEGAAVRAIGFGAGAVGPAAREAVVSSVAGDSFRYEPGTCPGDSGGPILVAGAPRIAGVVSTGAAGCASARAVAVAAHADWIRDAVDYLDPPACRSGDGQCGAGCRLGDADCPCHAGDGACERCDGVDPDCAGTCGADGQCTGDCVAPDPDCRVLGEGAACDGDVQCASSICHRGACREPCAPDGTGCPPWALCATGADEGVCLPSAGIGVQGGCAAAAPDQGAPLGPLSLASLAFLLWFLAPGKPRQATQRKGDPQ